jgi:hypothetical protein
MTNAAGWRRDTCCGDFLRVRPAAGARPGRPRSEASFTSIGRLTPASTSAPACPILIAVVVSLLSVIVVLAAAVKVKIDDENQRDKNQPPLL